jgi:regulatory protein
LIITAVERKRGRRNHVEICIDGVSLIELARTTVTSRGLRPGRDIDASEIDALVAADARHTALDTAAAMLARRPRSEREIRRKLAERKHDQSVIDETIERLRTMKLIDDAEFARTWTESRDRTSPRGKRMIAGELRAHGVTPEIARDATAEIDEEDAAYRVAAKRVRSLAATDVRMFAVRLGGYLQRRGFGWDVVQRTVRRCAAEAAGAADDRAEAFE